MIHRTTQPASRRTAHRRGLLGLGAGLAAIAATGGFPGLSVLPGPRSATARDYPPTEGQMQGFVLLKDRALAPRVPFFDADENVRHFSDFGRRVLLVNFWATWCRPCVHEMPALDALEARLGGLDFKVLAISQDRQGARVAEPFLRDRLGLANLDVFVDRQLKLGRALGVRGLPSTFLIDRAGNLVGGLIGPAEWDSEDALRLIRHVIDEGENGSLQQT